MFDRMTGSGATTVAGTTTDDYRLGDSGRHALFEDAELTPIFYGLVLGSRQRPARERTNPVDAFSRDPLTAPIPAQVLVPAAGGPRTPSQRTPGRRAAREPARSGGRHHYRG